MGIMIKPGTTATAKRELSAFIAAFPVNQIGDKDGLLLFWLPAGREDEAVMFAMMENNKFCGEFDIAAYLMEG